MFKITIFLLAFLSLQTTVRSVTTTTNLRLVYNADATLACSSSEASTFYKTTKAGATSAISASTHYSLNGNTLVIKKLKKDDVQSTYKCSSTSDTTIFASQVVPYLYQMRAKLVVAIEDYGVDLDCFLLVGTESNQTTVWQWKKSGTVIVAGDRVKIGGNNTQSVLTYAKPITTDSAIYECTATNSFGSFARTVELRVKSRAAPVWPFLGILGMASVLGLLIYFLDILPRSRLEKEEALKE